MVDTTVVRQDMFSYNILPIIIIGAVLAAFVIFAIVRLIIKHNKTKVKNEPANLVVSEIADVNSIKQMYLKQIVSLEKQLNNDEIDVRAAYQKMSEIIREFVFKVTKINVQTCTLMDISKLNMPMLTELIMDYYEPEFAIDSKHDVKMSIEKTKRVIVGWN